MRRLAAAIIVLCAALVAGPQALAGTYTVIGCQTALGQHTGWTAQSNRLDLIVVDSDCASGGAGLRVQDRLNNGGQDLNPSELVSGGLTRRRARRSGQ